MNLLAISAVSCGLMFMKGLISRVYKTWIVETISMTCYLNMALLSVSTFFSLETRSNQSTFAFISGLVMILLLLFVLSYHTFTEICLKVWKKVEIKCLDEASDLSNALPIDFDSRDHSPVDESMNKQLKNNRRELPTLPDCVNSLEKQQDENRAPLHRNSFGDIDTDSDASIIPLLNDY